MSKIFGIISSKKKIFIFSFLTGISGSSMLIYFGSMSALGYSIMLAVFALAVLCFFSNQELASRVACLLSFNIHIMVARALVTAIGSFITGYSIFELSYDPFCFWIILILTTIVSTVLSCLTLKIIPLKYLSQLGTTTEYLYYYIIITGLANVYMISNGNVYIHAINYKWLNLHQIIASLTWLFATYVVVIFLGISNIMRRRKENLEEDIIYKHVVESRSLAVIKVNCTKDAVLQLIFDGKNEPLPTIPYSDYSKALLKECMLNENFEKIVQLESAQNLINEYHKGNSLIEFTLKASVWGEIRWVQTSITITKEEFTNDIIAVITTTDDIHETKLKETALIAEAERDPLTHLYNKKATEMNITQHLEYDKSGSLFMIDLDNFKAINDTFGHVYGDKVLKEVTKKIIQNFRSDDIIGRIGGDEFVVFYKNTSDISHLETRAKQILTDIRHTYQKDGVSIKISCSIGIALADTVDSYQDLFQLADKAMYACKKTTKDGFSIDNTKNL